MLVAWEWAEPHWELSEVEAGSAPVSAASGMSVDAEKGDLLNSGFEISRRVPAILGV
jgi:hypothetical protein